MMRRFSAFLFICITLFLTSCTGTTAPTQPLFVIAGVQENIVASIVVLQDRVLETLPTNAPRFVRFASQPLAATAQAGKNNLLCGCHDV